MSISRRARGARADVSSQGRLWERDTDTEDGMQWWGHVRWCNAGCRGQASPDTMIQWWLKPSVTGKHSMTGPVASQRGELRELWIVMSGVSSIQFMDALKEISCKLGCRSHIWPGQWSEWGPDTASYAPVIVMTTWWCRDQDIAAPPLGTWSWGPVTVGVTPLWCVRAI